MNAYSYALPILGFIVGWLIYKLVKNKRGKKKKTRTEVAAGWVVGDGSGTKYRAWQSGPCWTMDLRHALRFARREDAEAFAADDEDAWRIILIAFPLSAHEREARRSMPPQRP